MLHINDITYRIAGRTLFEAATVRVPKGHKAGLVGRNGTGKSTLFRLIADDIHPDDGAISVNASARIGMVAQDAPDGPESLLDTVLAADIERASLMAEAETAADPDRIGEIHTRLGDIDAHTAPSRAAAILAGLGFGEEAQQRSCREFSGGWRMRVALAGALFARPDLLLLDEPTNHLDLEAAMWLEGYLASWPGTLVVISHERDLLNKVADEIIHLENGKLNRYAGNYDRFERTRRERLEAQMKTQARQSVERRRIQAFVDRFRAKATKARQAQSRIKMLERMEPIASVIEEKTPVFAFPEPAPLPPPLVGMDGLSVGYEADRPVLNNLRLRIDQDDRIALIGANGNGKTTLARLLAGRLAPMTGKMATPSKMKVGYFAQHQTEELDLDATPYLHMARALPDLLEPKVRAHLGAFGFSQDKADTKVENLSGGEKARLLFALMSADAPHMMILDEPTNHLDVDARQTLIQALNAYGGAVVLVSHDTHLVELVADRLWLVADGGCAPFDGDLDDYRRLLAESRRQARREDEGPKRATRKDARRERAQLRAETAPLRKEVARAEKRLDALSKEKAALEASLADPSLYQGPPEDVARLRKALSDLSRAMDETEHAWMESMEALENAS